MRITTTNCPGAKILESASSTRFCHGHLQIEPLAVQRQIAPKEEEMENKSNVIRGKPDPHSPGLQGPVSAWAVLLRCREIFAAHRCFGSAARPWSKSDGLSPVIHAIVAEPKRVIARTLWVPTMTSVHSRCGQVPSVVNGLQRQLQLVVNERDAVWNVGRLDLGMVGLDKLFQAREFGPIDLVVLGVNRGCLRRAWRRFPIADHGQPDQLAGTILSGPPFRGEA